MDRSANNVFPILQVIETDGQTYRWKDGQIERQMDILRGGRTDGRTDKWKNRQTDILTDEWTDRWKDRQIGERMDRQMGRRTDRCMKRQRKTHKGLSFTCIQPRLL